ncbi:MAG TPA: hypothetical protein VJL54_04505 [Nitrososphaera sp.]|nr:hypothetical protein [Nitrososphaera sp.]
MKIIIAVIIVATLSAGVAAYGWQSPPMASFDSDLHQFLQRTNSSLLFISRLQDTEVAAKHFEEYSLGLSNAALYKYLQSVDEADQRTPAPGNEAQVASTEVVISSSETRAIKKQISPALQEGTTDFDVYADDIEVNGRLYSLVLMVPK